MSDSIRADKWLWATRFFKTRALAAEILGDGKVKRNGHVLKRSSSIQAGRRPGNSFIEGARRAGNSCNGRDRQACRRSGSAGML